MYFGILEKVVALSTFFRSYATFEMTELVLSLKVGNLAVRTRNNDKCTSLFMYFLIFDVNFCQTFFVCRTFNQFVFANLSMLYNIFIRQNDITSPLEVCTLKLQLHQLFFQIKFHWFWIRTLEWTCLHFHFKLLKTA